MNLFKHLQKTPFLSQFLLGMLAIFALPDVQANRVENEQTIINQFWAQQESVELEQEQASKYLSQFSQEAVENAPQAVEFFPFFAKTYRFDGDTNHPIRAGPFFPKHI